MSRSIHWTLKKLFAQKSTREIEEMCDVGNPDYAVAEWRKKLEIKRHIKEARKAKKLGSGSVTNYELVEK